MNFPCNNGTSCQLSIRPRDLPSTFHMSAGYSIDLHQLYVHPRVHPSFFCASVVPFINFSQLSVHPRDLPSTFLASVRLSIKFLCGCRTFRKLLLTSVHPQHLPSTSINFPCISGTFHELKSTFRGPWEILSTFCRAAGPFVNFC